MRICAYCGDRWELRQLLLLADPSEDMVRRYLQKGFLLAAYEAGETVGAALTIPVEGGWELKNLAVAPAWQRRGIGSALIRETLRRLSGGEYLFVGTGSTPASLRFYQQNGFSPSHCVRDFFVDNYPEPIVEDGVQLRDMIYLKQIVGGGQ